MRLILKKQYKKAFLQKSYKLDYIVGLNKARTVAHIIK